MPLLRYPSRHHERGEASPANVRPPRSPESIVHAAVAHEGQAEIGGKVKLTLAVTLRRAQADRPTARAISEGKNLDAPVAEILEAAPTEPTA